MTKLENDTDFSQPKKKPQGVKRKADTTTADTDGGGDEKKPARQIKKPMKDIPDTLAQHSTSKPKGRQSEALKVGRQGGRVRCTYILHKMYVVSPTTEAKINVFSSQLYLEWAKDVPRSLVFGYKVYFDGFYMYF